MVINMKKFAIIEKDVVINIAIAELPIADNWIELPDHAGIGSTYKNGIFSDFHQHKLRLKSIHPCDCDKPHDDHCLVFVIQNSYSFFYAFLRCGSLV